jgi:tRNA(Ile)-lysidine synthase
MSAVVAADYEWLDAQFQEVWRAIVIETGDGWLRLSRQAWRDLPLSQQRMALRRGILQLRPSQTEISFAAIEQARQLCAQNVAGTQMDLPGSIKLTVDYEVLLFARQEIEPPALNVPQVANTAVLPIPGKITLQNGWHIETAVSTLNPSQIIKEATAMQIFVDVGDVAELYVRGRQPGERMQPLGMDGASTKLKEIMIDSKMARPYRANWPLVTTNKHPVWLVGQTIDERVKVTADSARIIQLTCYQSNEKK